MGGVVIVCLVAACQRNDASKASAASSAAPVEPAPSQPVAAAEAPRMPAGFEGEVTFVARSSAGAAALPPMTLMVKGALARLQLPEGATGVSKLVPRSFTVINAAENKLYTVVDEQKMIVVANPQGMAALLNKGKTDVAGAPPPKITKSARVATVAGTRCEEWDVAAADGSHGVACVSDERAPWLSMPSLGLGPSELWSRGIGEGKHLPLRMTSYDAEGTEQSHFEVTKLEKKPVPDALFTLPSGYRRIDMDQTLARTR
jgi:hypothetical protein